MKKIIISRDSLLNNQDLIKENINADLTSFIMDKVMTNQTSLSHCVALPRQDGVPFEYGLLQKRFSEVKNNIFEFSHIASTDEKYLVTVLSRMIVRCQELEKPIQNNLIKICENIVIDLFDIPSETINLSCKLVGKIEPKQGSINLLPENEGDIENYDYSNLLKFGDLTKQVLKRRLINSLIQGGAYSLGTMFELYGIENEELIDLYKRIIAINDFILFTVKEKVSDKHPKQGAYVEVLLGREGEKTEINAQGIIFPLLLIETIRGFLELFASHGLPKDNSIAKEVISHSDFLLAEPWDLRLGVPLWRILTKNMDDTKIIPYYFTNICKMHNQEFTQTLREIFSESIEGKKLRGKLMNVAENQLEYQQFVDKMQKKNADVTVITDGNMSIEDLDKIELSEDYRQLSLPFDGNTNKFNYEYYLDYLEKIGKPGTLPPNKWYSRNKFNIQGETAWEYDLDEIMDKMDTCSDELNHIFKTFLEKYINEKITQEYNNIIDKQDVYKEVYDIITSWDYTNETGYDEAFEEMKNTLNNSHIFHNSLDIYLPIAKEFLDEYIEYGDVNYPKYDEDMEMEVELQGRIEEIINKCNEEGYSSEIYDDIKDILDDLEVRKSTFMYNIGRQIESIFQSLIDNYFEIDKDGLLYIERGISIHDLLYKPQEWDESSYHTSIVDYKDGIGNCWSWSKGYGKAYSSLEDTQEIVIKGRVDLESVDWTSTLGLYFTFNNEREIRLKPNSIVEIDEIILQEDGRHLPFKEPLLVSSGYSYQGYY